MDGHVELRPMAEDDLPFVERLRPDPDLAGPFLWDGWHDPRRFRRRWEQDGWLGADTATLVVTVDTERIGLVSYRRVAMAGWRGAVATDREHPSATRGYRVTM